MPLPRSFQQLPSVEAGPARAVGGSLWVALASRPEVEGCALRFPKDISIRPTFSWARRHIFHGLYVLHISPGESAGNRQICAASSVLAGFDPAAMGRATARKRMGNPACSRRCLRHEQDLFLPVT